MRDLHLFLSTHMGLAVLPHASLSLLEAQVSPRGMKP
jgi:hypothetical protein